MRFSPVLIASLAASTTVVSPARLPLRAQSTNICHPTEADNESKLLVFYSGPITFSPGGASENLPAGAVRLGVEATYVPSPSANIRQPQACYGLKKTENTELSPVFPRPRVTIGLGAGFALEGSYLPPITVSGATPNLGAVALAHAGTLVSMEGGRTLDLSLRAQTTFGRVRGAITCPRASLQRRTATEACFGDSPSDDLFKPNMYAGEGTLALGGQDWHVYAGGGVLRLEPRFQVGFQQGNGFFDNTRIEVTLTKPEVFGGASWNVLPRVDLSWEVYSIPGRVVTGRVGAGYRIR